MFVQGSTLNFLFSQWLCLIPNIDINSKIIITYEKHAFIRSNLKLFVINAVLAILITENIVRLTDNIGLYGSKTAYGINQFFERTSSIICSALLIMCSRINFPEFTKIWNISNEIDLKLRTTKSIAVVTKDCKTNATSHDIVFILSWIIQLIVLIAYLHHSDKLFRIKIDIILIYQIGFTISALYTSVFNMVVSKICWYYRVIDGCFEHFSQTESAIGSSDAVDELREYMKISINVRQMCKLLEKFYGFGFLCLLSYVFFTVTSEGFSVLNVSTENILEFNTKVIAAFQRTAAQTVIAALVCSGFNKILSQEIRSAEKLSRTHYKHRGHRQIVDKFLTKLMRQKRKFTAYGFFVLDNSVLFKIFCAVASYLVILIQFKQLEEWKI